MSGGNGTSRLDWLDGLKGFAMVWIVVNHLAERLFGYPHIGNPHPDWPPLAERVTQLEPMQHLGAWGPLWNGVRWFGWVGDQGVQLFLIASGLGLGLGAVKLAEKFQAGSFYRRRLFRILPLWWLAHFVVFGAGFLFTRSQLSPTELKFYLSLLDLRWTPSLLYYGPASWWYIGLLLQLYAVFPLLRALQARWGWKAFLALSLAVGFVSRAAFLAAPGPWMDAGLRGIFFVTRLPEFAFGMSLALLHARDADSLRRWFDRPATLGGAALAWVVGMAASLTAAGMIFAPAVLGGAAFVWVRKLALLPGWPKRAMAWIGVHSYAIYLLHESWIVTWVPSSVLGGSGRVLVAIGLVLLATGVSGLALERIAEFLQSSRRSVAVRFAATAATGVAVLALVFGADALVRRGDPVEALGWGEREALRPDDAFGWSLKPQRETRLRWESYDYLVQSNELGFPGPSPDFEGASYRIMTVGDAYSSAEGVDTAAAWPRRLADDLAPEGARVANFSMTGYGPDQYARVVEHFAPQLRPDLLVVASFVNDFDDVLWTDEQFREDIGFTKPDPAALSQRVRVPQLEGWLSSRVVVPVQKWFAHQPNPRAWFYAYMDAFDRTNKRYEREGYPAARTRFERIAKAARALDCDVLLVLVPASVEVACTTTLDYMPGGIDLASDRFDLERPLRLGRRLGEECGIEVLDLRPTLSMIDRPYQPRNLHWTEAAHDAVAKLLADKLRGEQRERWAVRP